MSRKEESGANSPTLEIVTPSKLKMVIREQNGDDEEVISKNKNLLKGDSLHYFLAGIVMTINGNKIQTLDIENLRNRDKYYALLKSRMFSLGNEINFRHRCSNDSCTKEEGIEDPVYEQDLSLYDLDFSDDAKQDKREPYKYRVQAYPPTTSGIREFTLDSGKKVRYKFLTGVEEKKIMKMDKQEFSKTTDMVLRELEWLNPETAQWQKVTGFRIFSSRDMAQIRKDIAQNDMPFEVISECKCPFCGNVDLISLVAQPDFFFPGAI